MNTFRIILFIIVIILLLSLIVRPSYNCEYMSGSVTPPASTTLSNEAIQNIASVYNTNNLKVTNAEITNELKARFIDGKQINNSGPDLYVDGKRALVSSGKTLIVNYGPDYTDGTAIWGRVSFPQGTSLINSNSAINATGTMTTYKNPASPNEGYVQLNGSKGILFGGSANLIDGQNSGINIHAGANVVVRANRFIVNDRDILAELDDLKAKTVRTDRPYAILSNSGCTGTGGTGDCKGGNYLNACTERGVWASDLIMGNSSRFKIIPQSGGVC